MFVFMYSMTKIPHSVEHSLPDITFKILKGDYMQYGVLSPNVVKRIRRLGWGPDFKFKGSLKGMRLNQNLDLWNFVSMYHSNLEWEVDKCCMVMFTNGQHIGPKQCAWFFSQYTAVLFLILHPTYSILGLLLLVLHLVWEVLQPC
jgi:hypothetical protein